MHPQSNKSPAWAWAVSALGVLLLVGCTHSPRPPVIPDTPEELAAKVASYQAQIAAYDARPTAVPAAADTFCDRAVAAVQQYKAPGALVTVQTAVELSLSAERRPVKVQGWSLSQQVGEVCLVHLQTTLGNATQTYTWRWRPATGAVEAWDDATKRLAGW